MSLLLAQIGGGGGSVTASIGWTTQDATSALTADVSVTAAASWTTAATIVSATGAVSVAGSAAWTTADATHALSGAVAISGGIAWTAADATWAITGNVSAAGITATLGWTTEDAVTAISAQTAAAPVIYGGGHEFKRTWKRQTPDEEIAALYAHYGIEKPVIQPPQTAVVALQKPHLTDAIETAKAEEFDDLITILLLAA